METPLFGEITQLLLIDELFSTLKAPPGHVFMISYEQTEVSRCLAIYVDEDDKRISSGYFHISPVNLVCHTDVRLAQLFTKGRVLAARYYLNSVTRYDMGFRLFFSILPRHVAPKRLADRTWNCSVPHWPQFRSHLQCNLCTECYGAEDEVNCSHTTDRCGPGFLELGGACFFYRQRPSDNLTWMAASDVCTRWGGKLASLNTQQKWQDALQILQTNTWVLFKVFVGLLPPSAFKPLW